MHVMSTSWLVFLFLTSGVQALHLGPVLELMSKNSEIASFQLKAIRVLMPLEEEEFGLRVATMVVK